MSRLMVPPEARPKRRLYWFKPKNELYIHAFRNQSSLCGIQIIGEPVATPVNWDEVSIGDPGIGQCGSCWLRLANMKRKGIDQIANDLLT